MTSVFRKMCSHNSDKYLKNISQVFHHQFKPCHTTKRCISSGLDLTFKDDIGVITMKNKDNRINAGFIKDFNILLDSIEGSKTCKGFMSIGEGKFYSNGIDLDWLKNVSADEVIKYSYNLNALLLRVLMFPLPTMAVVNGHAFAGGAMLAQAHDIRIMNADKGWICLNEVYLGIKLSETMLAYVKMKYGGGKNVADALILGRRYTAAEALDCNIIHGAKPQENMEAEALKLFQGYVGKEGIPRSGVGLFKQHIYKSVQDAFDSEVADGYITFSQGIMNDTQKKQFQSSKS